MEVREVAGGKWRLRKRKGRGRECPLTVETIAILKNPPILACSPYKGHLARSLRPHHRPQLPTRGEQVNAAVAFIPQPDFGPQLANQPPILSAVGHPPTTAIAPICTLPLRLVFRGRDVAEEWQWWALVAFSFDSRREGSGGKSPPPSRVSREGGT